jgi:predicted phosphodiesterase
MEEHVTAHSPAGADHDAEDECAAEKLQQRGPAEHSSWDRVRDAIIETIFNFRVGHTHLNPHACIYLSRRSKHLRKTSITEVAALTPAPGNIRVVAISDTHGAHTSLGQQLTALGKFDVLIHCGDILFSSRNQSRSTAARKYAAFNDWMGSIDCAHRIVVAGNHDFLLEEIGASAAQYLLSNCIYLEHSGVTLGGNLRMWGTPVSVGRSRNRAFQSKQVAIDALNKAPVDVDILIAHGPPTHELLDRVNPHMLIVSGHYHEGYGVRKWSRHSQTHESKGTYMRREGHSETDSNTNVWYVSASTMDARYDPSFGPIIIDLSET